MLIKIIESVTNMLCNALVLATSPFSFLTSDSKRISRFTTNCVCVPYRFSLVDSCLLGYYLEAVAADANSLLEDGLSSPTPGTCAVRFTVAASSSPAPVTCAVSSAICFEPLLAAVF